MYYATVWVFIIGFSEPMQNLHSQFYSETILNFIIIIIIIIINYKVLLSIIKYYRVLILKCLKLNNYYCDAVFWKLRRRQIVENQL
jgi:hypothetical protein